MPFIRHLIQAICALLIVAFGSVAAMAMPMSWQQISFPVEAYGLTAQSDNLTNTARAPPTASENVLATGRRAERNGEVS